MTPICKKALQSRKGFVGTIEMYDAAEALKCTDTAKKWVADVASICYGNEEAKDFRKLFKRIGSLGHLSCLEFLPYPLPRGVESIRTGVLPQQSGRHIPITSLVEEYQALQLQGSNIGIVPAFLVEAPLFVARQWMRHRSFSYLEMSRRYTKPIKVAFSYYGGRTQLHEQIEEEYENRLKNKEPAELARGIMPMETMTKFWVAGYLKDWWEFIRLRTDDHAQPEIRVFAEAITEMLGDQNVAHNLTTLSPIHHNI